MSFPVHRMRRLRRNETMRRMVRECSVGIDNLIYPIFAVHGKGVQSEIKGMPGNFHFSVDKIGDEVEEIAALGIPAVLLFGVPEKKDPLATESYASDGIVQRAIREIKNRVPELIVITDVCLCEYTEHGHCGIVKNGYLENDSSLELIGRVTGSHAAAGADMVAPAAMLDGQIRTMRSVLDSNGFENVAIMAYSAKYASKLYDLFFKHGTGGVLTFGDKKTHQMDFSNSNEALREISLDIEEGADIIMVKPGLMYLDIVYRAKQEFKMPLAVYNVSGEYAMIKAAAREKQINENEMRLEIMTAFRRAGADMVISYHAKELARQLSGVI
jgi:porphobilinogen synthase